LEPSFDARVPPAGADALDVRAEAVDALRPWLRIHREAQGAERATIEVRRLL
jgi:hypothetical protein